MGGSAYTVLIIGGYGTFGGRLATLLADEPRLNLIVGGRSLAKAEDFCQRPSAASLVPQHFDREGDLVRQFEALQPNLVVDATGPFQTYGDDPYRVVRAAIACGIDYLDLADGTEYVLGIGELDGHAKSAGRFALSGTSTCPALTAAVVRELASDLTSMDRITIGIAPAPTASLGLSVIQAIASRVGQPVAILENGENRCRYASLDTLRYQITLSGKDAPLSPRLFSLVDVPDLKLLPRLWPGVKSVWLGAGPVPEVGHWALLVAAWLVRLKLLPSLTWAAPLMKWVMDGLRWGDDRGGMFVNVKGIDRNGNPAERFWHMVAEGDDGPYIPSMAAAAVIRHCLEGRAPTPGARPAIDDISLSDYEAQFRKLGITTVTGP
jgi:hypothetical protein